MGDKLSNLEVKLADVQVKPFYRKGKPVKGFLRRARQGFKTHINQGINIPENKQVQFNTVPKMHPDIEKANIGDELTITTPMFTRRGTLAGKNKNGIVLLVGDRKVTIYSHHIKKVIKGVAKGGK